MRVSKAVTVAARPTFTDGQVMSIAQNSALFSLLGTTFGGGGRVTFNLPDLRGRSAMHEHKNIFCIDEDDRSVVEPSPVRHYRADRFSPRLPLNHCWATYSAVAVWRDRAILTYVEIRKRMLKTGDTENLRQKDSGHYTMALPLSWLYEKCDTSRRRASHVGSEWRIVIDHGIESDWPESQHQGEE